MYNQDNCQDIYFTKFFNLFNLQLTLIRSFIDINYTQTSTFTLYSQSNSIKNMQLLLLLLSCLITIICVQQPYKLVKHNTDPEAKCLDGSSPALYVHEGGDPNNYLIFFVGGGFCAGINTQQVLDECYKRSKTDMGSSKYLKPQLISPGGYVSTDPANSRFANWTKVIVMYCDGSQHQGHNNQPIAYKDTQLYFRGSDNTRSHFKWLLKTYNIQAAERIVLTGASAGGIATIMWSNYFKNLLKNPSSLSVIVDSGIFANTSFPYTKVHIMSIVGSNLFKVSNIDEKTPLQACNAKFPGQEYKCVFVQNSYQFLQNEMLFINSQYDQVGLQITEDMNCMSNGASGKTLKNCGLSDMDLIEKYRSQYLDIVKTLVQRNHSVWTIACCQHAYACYQDFYDVKAQRIPQLVGSTVKDAIQKFVFEKERVVMIDKGPWPSNAPCAF